MLAGSEPLPSVDAPMSTEAPLPPLPGDEDVGEGELSSSRSDNATAGGSNPPALSYATGARLLPLAVRIQRRGGNSDPNFDTSASRHYASRYMEVDCVTVLQT